MAQAGFFVRPPDATGSSSGGGGGNSGAGSTSSKLNGRGLLEVMRVSHPSGENLQSAYGPEAAGIGQTWYWHAPGSGIFLTPGRSLVVPNRSALLVELAARLAPTPLPFAMKRVKMTPERGMRLCEGCSDVGEAWHDFHVVWWSAALAPRPPAAPAAMDEQQARLCEMVRRVGFDTVQLTHAFDAQRFEIIDCRQMRPKKDGAADLASPSSASASTAAYPPAASRMHLWNASVLLGGRGPADGSTCKCVHRPFLNCGGCARAANVTRLVV